MTWHDRAACKDDPHPECWFGGPGDHEARMRAGRICLACPVRNECLAEELELCRQRGIEPFGVRAGMSENERRKMIAA
jgi:Small-conductance mechanosensitive channel